MEVASISINPSATRGEDLDGIPGDEGVVLLVQPRSDSGNVIQTTGDLTVSIIDPRESDFVNGNFWGSGRRFGNRSFLQRSTSKRNSD